MSDEKFSLNEFLAKSDALDSSVETMELSREIMTKRDGAYFLGDKGYLSDRALKNFCAMLGIPQALVRSSSEGVLNELIQEQIVEKDIVKARLGFTPSKQGEIAFLQREELPYIPYSSVLQGFGDNIWKCYGSPITDDGIRIVVKNLRIEVEKEDLFTGVSALVSHTSRFNSGFEHLLFRVICENGLMSETITKRYSIPVRNASAELMQTAFKTFGDKSGDFGKEMKNFVVRSNDWSMDNPAEQVLDHVENTGCVTGGVVKSARKDAERIRQGGNVRLENVGLCKLDTLWDYTNLLTYQAQKLGSVNSRLSNERGAFRWANSCLN